MRIIELGYQDNIEKGQKENLKVVDYNEFVLPYICNIGKFVLFFS